MLHLKENPTFQDIQKYVRRMEKKEVPIINQSGINAFCQGKRPENFLKQYENKKKGSKLGSLQK